MAGGGGAGRPAGARSRLPPAGALPAHLRAGWEGLVRRCDSDDPLRLALLIDTYKCLLDPTRSAAGASRLRVWGAVALAAVGFVATALRDLRHGVATPESDAGVWVFVHGPGQTRSEHVLRLAEEEPGGKVAIFAVGRAGVGLLARRYAGLLSAQRMALVCPITLSGVFAALWRLPAIARFLREADAASGGLGRHELAGTGFRGLRGLAFAHWIGAVREAPAQAVFGHTGTAETMLPELALQERGCRTIHLLHGKVDGPVFFGLTDVALCRSRFDARLLSSFGGYGRTLSPPPPQPPLAQGGDMLVCSNLAHPMGAAYRAVGIAAEADFIRLVGEARSGGTAEVVWRLHPAFDLLPAGERSAIETALADAGFRRGEADAPLAAEMTGRLVVTPPSTVFSEAVAVGAPALLYRAPFVTEGTFAEAVPVGLCFGNAEELGRILATLAADPAALDDARRTAAEEFAAEAPRSLAEVISLAGSAPLSQP